LIDLSTGEGKMGDHICPLWAGRVLSSPLRKLYQNPRKILDPYVTAGMTVLDAGCAMGFFSLPIARMVGPHGKVFCVDVQQRMIETLEKRARKAGLSQKLVARVCAPDSLGLNNLKGKIDFSLAFAVLHEAPDARSFLSDIHSAMKPQGTLLLAEPSGRVSEEDFRRTISIAQQVGFKSIERPRIRRSRAVLLGKIL
jgi:2-polyprenyl-3-methyl-5-hydroxy-6-metoxy-1,4-benzoquinol methylase